MIRSFRDSGLKQLWENGDQLPNKTLIAEKMYDVLDSIDVAGSPLDPAFIGFRFHEWKEENQPRYGLLVTDHWLISYSWSDGHAVDVDLERID
jgi:plasmid maintenance system killer protein